VKKIMPSMFFSAQPLHIFYIIWRSLKSHSSAKPSLCTTELSKEIRNGYVAAQKDTTGGLAIHLNEKTIAGDSSNHNTAEGFSDVSMKDPSPPQAFHRFNANDLGGKTIPIILVLCVCLPFLIMISMSDFNRHRPLPSPEMMRMPRPDSQRSLQASFQISVTVEIRSRNIQLGKPFYFSFIPFYQTLSDFIR
jgi:hypothetical protein